MSLAIDEFQQVLSEILVFKVICSVEWNFVCMFVSNPPYIQASFDLMFEGEGKGGCLPDYFP